MSTSSAARAAGGKTSRCDRPAPERKGVTVPRLPRYACRMSPLRHALAAVLLLGLAACGQPAADAPAAPPGPAASAPPPSTPVPAAATALALDPGGLMLVMTDNGSTRLIDFGLPQAQALEILGRVVGPLPAATTNSECGAGPLQFVEAPDGLTLLFQDGRFVGWSAGPASKGKHATMAGIGVGSTRSQLTAAVSGATIEETSLGQEFSAGGLYGVLSGADANATIDTLWAGTSCVFR